MHQNLFSRGVNHSQPWLTDLVIRAGTIHPMIGDRKVYRAIAIRDEWIVAVSEDPHGLDALVTAGTHVVDDSTLTILPTFDDTHNHFILAAQNSSLVPVDRAHTLAEFTDLCSIHSSRCMDHDLGGLARGEPGRRTPADCARTRRGNKGTSCPGQTWWPYSSRQLPGPLTCGHHT